MTASMMKAVDRAVTALQYHDEFSPKQSLPEVNKQPMSSAAFLQGICGALQKVCGACELRVARADDFTFAADSELLTRAVDNLVRNAAQAGRAPHHA